MGLRSVFNLQNCLIIVLTVALSVSNAAAGGSSGNGGGGEPKKEERNVCITNATGGSDTAKCDGPIKFGLQVSSKNLLTKNGGTAQSFLFEDGDKSCLQPYYDVTQNVIIGVTVKNCIEWSIVQTVVGTMKTCKGRGDETFHINVGRLSPSTTSLNFEGDCALRTN